MDTEATDALNAPKSAEVDEEQAITAANDLTEQVFDAEKINLEKDTPDQERITHHSDEEVAAAREAIAAKGDFDLFAWATNLFQATDQLKIDLFLINKNNVLYRTKTSPEIEDQLQPLFITPMLEHLMMGAGAGMVVREFEQAEEEKNVVQFTKWENILRLTEVMHWLHTQEDEMEVFKEEEHDIKRIKGIVARCSHPSMKDPFFVIKVLPSAQTFKGEGAWMAQGDRFVPFEAPAFRIPADNQMVVIDKDIYVFNQAKLERMFGYNAKKNSIAEQKVKEIESQFKLSFGDDMTLQSLVKGNKPTINKLQNIEIGEIKQDDLIDHAEELGVDLMVDEDGAIIIESTKDLTKFVNLLNDDYYESQLTGIKYEIRGKRAMRPPKDEAAAEIAL